MMKKKEVSMLDDFIKQLGQELEMQEFIRMKESQVYSLEFANETHIEISSFGFDKGLLFRADICPCPQSSPDVFFNKVMAANLFAKETEKSIIGLNPEGNLLTLSFELNYSKNYIEFRDALENFINIINVWRTEASQHR